MIGSLLRLSAGTSYQNYLADLLDCTKTTKNFSKVLDSTIEKLKHQNTEKLIDKILNNEK